jgi:hypothetical protein
MNRYTLNSYIDVNPAVAANINGIYGEWLQLKLPYKINLGYIVIQTRDGDGNIYGKSGAPGAGNVWGSNDGANWTLLTSFSNLTYGAITVHGFSEIVDVNSIIPYSYIRLQPTKRVATNGTDGWIGFGELKLFGTREQLPSKQSVLHDGQLTLTKSLNVPRIGPAFDVDDTPRRDRLILEFNTSTNPVIDGVVRDSSGRGNDGGIMGKDSVPGSVVSGPTRPPNTFYDANQKAFNFDGSGDYIQTKWFSSLNREFTHTWSAWVKIPGPEESFEALYGLGNSETAGEKYTTYICTNSDGTGFRTEGDAGLGRIDHPLTWRYYMSKWTHIAIVKSGASIDSIRVYINGQIRDTTTAVNATNVINQPAGDIDLRHGTTRSGGYPYEGLMSSIKMWDVALNDGEVNTLYNMGQYDEGHHMVNFAKTRVGIGLGDGDSPASILDVRGGTTVDELTTRGILIVNAAGGERDYGPDKDPEHGAGRKSLFIPSIESTMFDRVTPGVGGLDNGWWMGCQNQHAGGRGDLDFYFTVVEDGVDNLAGLIQDSVNNGQMNFTGQHRTFIKDVPFSQAGDLEGLIVSSDQNKYIKMSGGIEAGSNAITTNESLPIVSLSNVATDKKCFGVISASEDPKQRSDSYGNFVTPYKKEKGDTRVYINSVGEGAIWVSNIGGNLEAGDYITTSNVAGYGQKQESDSLKNYTVAKITMDCDFNPATQPVQQILRSNVIQTYYLGNVHKVKSVPHEFVTTTVGADDTWSNVSVKPSDVTYAEWSNLEANTQNTYTLTYTQTSNVVYDTKYTLTTTANVTESDPWDSVFVDPPDVTYAEYSNLEANTQSSYSLTFTKTTTDEKTPEEWSSLESNTQSLYNMVYYQSVEEEVASDYPGATTHTRVTDVIENELDAHGQIQWEDHPTETEKAYKIRYLDVSGAQTDSANAVHIAAFVGCTYHCG